MKKQLLFVIESLALAGAEKSLVSLLNLIDYKKYDVELQLFSYGGELEGLLPKEVKLLPKIQYFKNCEKSFKEHFIFSLKYFSFIDFNSRIKTSMRIRQKKYTNPEKAVITWKSIKKSIPVKEKKYDVAIAYAQGLPTFYVGDKIIATKKLGWVNAIYKPEGIFYKYATNSYKRFNQIICVSKVCQEIFNQVFQEHSRKSLVIMDILSGETINKLAKSELLFDLKKDKNIVLLTIGRLSYQKGYDIAINACKTLKEKKISFKWYILGKGGLENEIVNLIRKNELEEYFILLGTIPNPYPLIKNCDIYVQTSKFEGYGLAIAEARILNKPIVTTAFDAVYDQMIHEKNGLVVDMDGEAIANGIIRLINEADLRSDIIEVLANEKKGNVEEIDKFYKLIEGDLD